MGKIHHTRYVIVPHRPERRPLLLAALVLAWLLTVGAAWLVASWYAAPQLPGLSAALETARSELKQVRSQLQTLSQRQAILERSDQISRAANREVQQALAERDEEIGGLRANLAFYERLAGATVQPKGLNVHSAEFSVEQGGTWRYQIVLTQNLQRGAISAGKLRFAVEGVRNGKLASIPWEDLHQRAGTPAQVYSFRYFQQLQGSVMLPPGFTPQRVRVSLRGNDASASVDQALAWAQPSQTGDT